MTGHDMIPAGAEPLLAVLMDSTSVHESGVIDRIRGTLQQPRIEIIAIECCEGQLAALQQVLRERRGGRDLLLTASSAVLPPAWDLRLHAAAHADRRVGVACAMTAAHPAYSPLPADLDRSAWSSDSLDRAVLLYGDHAIVDVPAPHALASFWHGDVLDQLLAEECEPVPARLGPWLVRAGQRLRALGRSVVILDAVFVDGPPAAEYRLDATDEQALRVHGVLGHIGRKIAATDPAVASRWPRVGLSGRPVILHVMHYWGGGLDKWVREYIRADGRHDHLLLTAYRIGTHGGQRIELYADAESRQPLRVWDIALPIRSVASTHVEFRRVLHEVVECFDVDAVMVSSLIGHTLDSLDLNLPVIWVAHDFFPVCEALNPRFRGETCPSCDAPRLTDCRASNPGNALFKDWPVDDWLALRRQHAEKMAHAARALIAPSQFVLDTMHRLEPVSRAIPSHIIPHGLERLPERIDWATPAAGERLRIVVLGVLNPSKGATLFEASANELAGFCDLLIMGCSPKAAAIAERHGWTVLRKYNSSELYQQVLAFRPHCGLLLSVVPETFSYTLSELWALGVPPVATRLGALAERIREGIDGFLVEPDAKDVVETLRSLAGNADPLAVVAKSLADRQPRTSHDMAADYAAVLERIVPNPVVTRFAVRWSNRTALTDAYAQLDAALATYRDAYASVQAALGATQQSLTEVSAALGDARDRLSGIRAEYRSAIADVRAMELRRHPWRIRAYLDRLLAFGETTDRIAAGDSSQESTSGQSADPFPAARD